MKNEQVFKVFWTSGWDSTFTVAQYFRQGAHVKPYYVYDDNRSSRDKEIESIGKLSQLIKQRFADSGGQLDELTIIKRQDIKQSLRSYFSYKILKSRAHLGRQYFWLARLTKELQGTAVSVHKDGSVDHFIGECVKEVEDSTVGKYCVLKKNEADKHVRALFGNMSFPVIKLTKLDMKAIAEQHGFLDILHSTWFCHNSTTTPCGHCNPCKSLAKFGLAYRLDE